MEISDKRDSSREKTSSKAQRWGIYGVLEKLQRAYVNAVKRARHPAGDEVPAVCVGQLCTHIKGKKSSSIKDFSRILTVLSSNPPFLFQSI